MLHVVSEPNAKESCSIVSFRHYRPPSPASFRFAHRMPTWFTQILCMLFGASILLLFPGLCQPRPMGRSERDGILSGPLPNLPCAYLGRFDGPPLEAQYAFTKHRLGKGDFFLPTLQVNAAFDNLSSPTGCPLCEAEWPLDRVALAFCCFCVVCGGQWVLAFLISGP